jgi:DNA repair protein RadA/Sms
MKLKTEYICSNCSYTQPKWIGKCPNCDSWNSFFEQTVNIGKPIDDKPRPTLISEGGSALIPKNIDQVLDEIKSEKAPRVYEFSSQFLNKFWGGGLVAGGLTLLAGEPGLGKSTLSLQLLRALRGHNKNLVLLYITAEESSFELARRSERLKIPKDILVVQSNNFEQIETLLKSTKPDVVIIDSIQTVSSSGIAGSPGSISQVASLTNNFLAISKALNISIILVGHVTKEGQIAGPKTLEHMVDSVLMIQSEDNQHFRTLTFSKHRFGTTSNLLLMKMETTGLEIVTDPSLALLENLEIGVGVVYGLAMDKNLALVVEIQALVGNENYSEKSFGRREALGVKTSKLNTILAIIEKYLGISLKNQDVYLQLTGLPKNTVDESLDLPIMLAILSSLKNKNISDLFGLKQDKNQKLGFAGRLTLSGKIRQATHSQNRLETAQKLKFNYNAKIEAGNIQSVFGKIA